MSKPSALEAVQQAQREREADQSVVAAAVRLVNSGFTDLADRIALMEAVRRWKLVRGEK